MMTVSVLRVALMLATAAAPIVAVAGLRNPLIPPAEMPTRQAAQPSSATVDSTPVSVSLERTRDRPLFRQTRQAASAAFDPALRLEEDAPPAASVPKPPLQLSGILWGAEGAAVLEGVPGAEGSTVLRRGERVGGLRVVRIGRESATVEGFDTTWVLTVRNPWP